MALSNAVVSQICKGVQRGATARSMAGAPRTFSVVHNQVEEDVAAVDYTIDDDGFATVTLAQPGEDERLADSLSPPLLMPDFVWARSFQHHVRWGDQAP